MSALILLAFLLPTAKADDSPLSELLQNEALSEDSAQALVTALGPDQPYSVSDYDQCPAKDLTKPPSFPAIKYKGFHTTPGSASKPIYLDEYDPPTTYPGPYQGPFTVMVLVHGGGFWRGCRYVLQDVAWEGSGHDTTVPLYKYFVVLNIDYRLSCDPNDPNLPNSPILPLCGWQYPVTDPDTQKIGASIQDVQSAVRWVTNVWSGLPNRPAWDHRVVLLGGSAGGTFAYSAVAPSPNVGGAVTVNEVAGWSGALELNQMSNSVYPCALGQTNDAYECQQSENKYLQCNLEFYPDPVCANLGRYIDASPRTWYTSTLPHAFFANGGGPDPSYPPELVALQSALDFDSRLQSFGWLNHNQYVDCIVNAPAHGRGLRSLTCNDDSSVTVWYETSEFLYGVTT